MLYLKERFIHSIYKNKWRSVMFSKFPKVTNQETFFYLMAHSFQLCSHYHISSVQFSCSVVSDSLQPRESQHARPPCPSLTPRVYSNSCLSSQWYHPAISSSVILFSSFPQSLPASGSFPMRQLFAWDDQSIGVSASASVLPMNTGYL